VGHTYSYDSLLATSARVSFRLDDVLHEHGELDFTRPFLPESLTLAGASSALSASERLRLSQVRGYSYLCLFGVVEEFILPFVIDHARADLAGDDVRTRALLGFAGEEAKHIQLFKRFKHGFERDWGSPCALIGPTPPITRAILGHGPLGVALLILHIEWMTQRHYVDSVRDDTSLDPQFKRLLKYHWLEEAQHAKLDTLMVEQLAAELGPREIDEAIEEYIELTFALRNLLEAQLSFDLQNLQAAIGRSLSASDRSALLELQRRAAYWTFLGSGMTHPNFAASVLALSPTRAPRVRAVAEQFCSTHL